MARKQSKTPAAIAAAAPDPTLFAAAGSPMPTPPSATPPGAAKPTDSIWTDDQWAGITTTGRNLLVSAAAGSGKTAVLAERCAYLVCDAPDPCDVDELLVVTFTEAAAAERKARIEKALRQRVARALTPAPRLRHQLALIDRAQVSTLHGFCARLLRQHFHLLGLDPSFSVLDGDEAALLRLEVARGLFADRHEDARRVEAFQQFIDLYGDGNDERLLRQVIELHDMTASLFDPRAWLATAQQRIDGACGGDLESSELGRELLELIRKRLAGLRGRCDGSLAMVSRMGGFAKYETALREMQATLTHWQSVLDKDGLDALSGEMIDEFPRLPSIASATPGKEIAKQAVDSVRKDMKSGVLREMLRFSTAQWRDGMIAMRPHAHVLLGLVEEFAERYQREKAALRSVDFSDLERLALKVLSDGAAGALAPSNVARMLHRQFRHVLVDEYQDINELQDAILTLVSRECLGTHSSSREAEQNLFCVGDVKQSIYRFRLAEPGRFMQRQARFRDGDGAGTVIDLQANFRSRAPLLGALNDLFAKLMTRQAADIEYDATHLLRPGLQYPPANGASCFTGAPIELHLMPQDMQIEEEDSEEPSDAGDAEEGDAEPDRGGREALLIARRIREMIGAAGAAPMCVMERRDGVLSPRPIEFRDIVILLRSMRYKADDYAEMLRRGGIPVHTTSGKGYFDTMEVRDVLALLAVLDNRRQDVPLAAVLRSPMAAIPLPDDALASIRLAYRGRGDGFVPFHQAVIQYARERDDELAAKLRDLIHRLDRWREMAQRRPLAELIGDIYTTTGYLAFCAGLRDGEQRTANLIDLYERARQFGTFQRQGLARFLQFLQSLRSESDLGQPPVISEGENVVRIMSVHHSKGLEFPVVFLPDLGKAINLSDCAGSILMDRRAYLSLDVADEARRVRYPSLASVVVRERLKQQALAEELRVLYVAATRAREHLVLIGTCGEAKTAAWTSRWSDFDGGALPADLVLGARCMLDWIGPAAVALRRGGREPIHIIQHVAEEIAGWGAPETLRPIESDRLMQLARLEPLQPAPPENALANEILARLTEPYRFEPFTRLAAADSATAEAKRLRGAQAFAPAWAANSAPSAASAQAGAFEHPVILEPPRAIRTKLKPSAAEIGSATHLVLQHLDFRRPCDPAGLQIQLRQLVDRRLIPQNDADAVDLEAICWVAGSTIGQLMRDRAADVRRELPLYFARPPGEYPDGQASTDPADAVMLRSRLDALIVTPRGIEIIDYKTDQLTGEQVPSRTEIYRPQMALYRRAVEAMTGQKVSAVHLVFLSARVVQTVV
jgi:ATP-dependent helicase/nuclease subunit A